MLTFGLAVTVIQEKSIQEEEHKWNSICQNQDRNHADASQRNNKAMLWLEQSGLLSEEGGI